MNCSKERCCLDLKYLTVADLEKFLENLQASIKDLESNDVPVTRTRHQEKRLKEEKELVAEIESEILERTVLGYKPPGGVTN